MKNFRMLVAVAMIGSAALTVSSCGKYEDGPGISLRTKKARLTGEWDVKEYVDGSTGATTADNSTSTTLIDKDGTLTVKDGATSISGTWTFAADKERLSVTLFSSTSESIITRLTNKALWMKDPSSGDITKAEKL
jgi:hypothetical protein